MKLARRTLGVVIAAAAMAVVLGVTQARTLRVEWAMWTAADPAAHLEPGDAPKLLPYVRSPHRGRRATAQRLLARWWQEGRLDPTIREHLAVRLMPVTVSVRRWCLAGRPIRVRVSPVGTPACEGILDYRWQAAEQGGPSMSPSSQAPEGVVELPPRPAGETVVRVGYAWTPSAGAEPVWIDLPPQPVTVAASLPAEELAGAGGPAVDEPMRQFLRPRIDRARRTAEGLALDVALVSTHNLPVAVAAMMYAVVDGRRFPLTAVYCPEGRPVARYWEGLVLKGYAGDEGTSLWLRLEPQWDIAYDHAQTHVYWSGLLEAGPLEVRPR